MPRWIWAVWAILSVPCMAATIDYLEQFDGAGQPSVPGHWWAKSNDEYPAGQSTWDDFCPGDGYARLEVDATRAANNDRAYQTISFGDVGPGHRLEIRAQGLVVPGLTGFIFTYAYMWDGTTGWFDEIDTEVVADDTATASHAIYPPDGHSDARFNTWSDVEDVSPWPVDYSTFAGIKDENGDKVSHIDGQFHTYTIDWYPDRIQFFIDGVFQCEHTISRG